jgi:hypothetical protein
MHSNPGLFFGGAVCSNALILWLIPAVFYLIRGFRSASLPDAAMFVGTLLVALAMIVPDTLFAST